MHSVVPLHYMWSWAHPVEKAQLWFCASCFKDSGIDFTLSDVFCHLWLEHMRDASAHLGTCQSRVL
eukprot:jgi/Botrbrau1/9306/Bobra.0111s0030.1